VVNSKSSTTVYNAIYPVTAAKFAYGPRWILPFMRAVVIRAKWNTCVDQK